MPSEFHIITSNRMETLAARLAEVLQTASDHARAHPLRPATVMIQSKGMQRWISLTIARLTGICANVAFPFPNAFLETLYTRVVGPLPQDHIYEPHVLTFRILNILPDLLRHPEFEHLRRYLSDQHRPLKLYQLARKIADVFDQYAVYRPDLLLAWGNKDHGVTPAHPHMGWQRALWHALVSETKTPHRSVLQKELVRMLSDSSQSVPLERLPAGLSVFGISYLPPFHLEVLEALAYRVPVYLFLLNPCRHYWFDILSDHQMIRVRATQKKQSLPIEQLHLERGNRLLASLGHLGKQFFDRIYQFQANLTDEFIENPTDTILGRVQQDILDLMDHSADASEHLPAADGTLRIHSCHSPMREVEVLHDQLLDMLDHRADLQPRDILVMTPDIGLYSPFIHAVFGAGGSGRTHLPFSVADQSIAHGSNMIESFIRLLDLVDRRFEASRVLMLLDCGAVRRRFALNEADLPIVEKWIDAAGIRWGWDGAERRRHNLPGFKENSWRSGLDRLILGYAMAPGKEQLFSGVLPHDAIGAGEASILGRLVAFAEAVHNSFEQLAVSDSLSGWHMRLNAVLDRLFRTDDQAELELHTLRSVIEQLQNTGLSGDERRPVAFEVVRQHIKDSLGRISHDTGFMSGGITFCAMLPMRSIPAEVICLLGMNHDAYPREQHEPGFNLIAQEPRSGDRSRRNDDRYLFLETLISARDTLYISYVGQNIQDNSPIPPSVLVDEIVEYVNEGFGIPIDQFVTRHPLQAFSPSYFNGLNPLLFSYSVENRSAAAQSTGDRKSAPPLFDAPLQAPQESWRECDLEQLAAFFAHPARYLMEQRLGVFLNVDSPTTADRENFTLDALECHKINQQILESSLRGSSPEQIYMAMGAAGVLPHGTVGKVFYQELSADVRAFREIMTSLLPEDTPRTESVELNLSPFRLCGNLDKVFSNARVIYRMAKMRPADLLRTFFSHLAMLATPELPKISILICKDGVWHFGRTEDPYDLLKEYLNLYWQGLHKPLPFFNRTSYEFAHQCIVRQQPQKPAIASAASKWRGNEFVTGESEDPYNVRCFGDQNPLSAEFEEIALKVYAPLFSACRTSKEVA